MVYGFAKQSGGAMRIDSVVDEGTRVEIWLPRAPEAAARKGPSAAESPAFQPGKSLRILLADDHSGVRATTAALLQDLGHEVFEACDGPALIARLEDAPHDCDIIISDYAMPLVSGADVIERARALRPGLPCVLITGYAEIESIARRPQDVPVLAKPFSPEQLSQAIRTALCQGTVHAAA
jgi:CheY-like chemotaxis protein